MINAEYESRNKRVDVLGVGFDDISMEQAVLQACEMIKGNSKAYAVTPNPEIVLMARSNEQLKNALNGADLVLPDGIGIIHGARILGKPLESGRVPGIDFASALFEKMTQFGGSLYLFGAKPGVAAEAGEKLKDKYPGLKIAGTSDGYFDDDNHIIESINKAQPDLLLVCLGSPKQELWMAANIGLLDAKLCAGLGGSLDIFAGRIKRAPIIFRKLGFEWLYRVIREPRRIKRIFKLPIFILILVINKMRGISKWGS